MKILIADDDAISRRILQSLLGKLDAGLILTSDGNEAWSLLTNESQPILAILDWIMPGLSGIEICRLVREQKNLNYHYIILVTSNDEKSELLEGFEAGANDYIIKPFDYDELRARVNVGVQMIRLQTELKSKVRELEEAITRVNRLQGLIPICSCCKKIRDDSDYWHRVEEYIGIHADVQFTHSLCPECSVKQYELFAKKKTF